MSKAQNILADQLTVLTQDLNQVHNRATFLRWDDRLMALLRPVAPDEYERLHSGFTPFMSRLYGDDGTGERVADCRQFLADFIRDLRSGTSLAALGTATVQVPLRNLGPKPSNMTDLEFEVLTYMISWQIKELTNYDPLPKHFHSDRLREIFYDWHQRGLVALELSGVHVTVMRSLEHYLDQRKVNAPMHRPNNQIHIGGSVVGAVSVGGNATTGDILNVEQRNDAALLQALQSFSVQIEQNAEALAALQELMQKKDDQMAVASATQKLALAEPKSQNFLIATLKECGPKAVGTALFEGIKFYARSKGWIA